MQVKLFDEYDRTYMDYKGEDESHYSYLNRTARPEFAPARQMLEEWFAAYPPERQATLTSNFTSDNYGPHFGAFFELYCYTLFRALDFEVHVEQVVDEYKGNPIDFVVGPPQTPRFCVESTVIADAELTVKSQQQLEKLKQRLNRISSNRRLILDVGGTSKQPLPYNDIAADVAQWLGALDWAGAGAPDLGDDPDAAPSHTWTGKDWSLLFRVLPGERVGDLVPMQYEGGWVGSMSRLKRTLQQKADQHKGIEAPYIIAVDVLGKEAIFRSSESILEDLFGKRVIIFDRQTDTVLGVKWSPELPGRPDREKGLWLGRSGPRNQHVSAVLLVNEVVPWSVMKQTPVLLHNPWARHPVSPLLWPGPQMLITDRTTGAYGPQEGKTIAEILQGYHGQ